MRYEDRLPLDSTLGPPNASSETQEALISAPTANSAFNEASAHQSEGDGLVHLFDDIRKRLVETGTRNRLVHVNRATTRGNVVNIVNERADDVYAILSARRVMRFLATERDRSEASDDISLAKHI
jgi:hypothetical protein